MLKERGVLTAPPTDTRWEAGSMDGIGPWFRSKGPDSVMKHWDCQSGVNTKRDGKEGKGTSK